MPTSRPVALALELQACDEHVAGKLIDERGERHSFSTWLHLLTLLERARRRSLISDEHPTQSLKRPEPRT